MVARGTRACSAVALAVCGLLAAGCSSAPGPREEGGAGDGALKLETHEWDFGTLKRGESAARALTVTNEGPRAVAISARTSCDCLIAETEADTLAPGETARLTLTFIAEDIKDRVTKTAYVQTDEPGAAVLTMTVTGSVVPGDGPHLVCIPSPMLFEKSSRGFEPGSLRVVNRGLADLEVTAVRCFGCAAGERAFTLAADGEMEMEVDLVEDWTGVRWLELDSNDPVAPTRKVPLVVLE